MARLRRASPNVRRPGNASYDAVNVALVEHLTCRLVIADHRLAPVPGPACDIEVIG